MDPYFPPPPAPLDLAFGIAAITVFFLAAAFITFVVGFDPTPDNDDPITEVRDLDGMLDAAIASAYRWGQEVA